MEAALKTLKATSTKGHVAPIPTVIPTPTEFQSITHDGVRALWVLFVIFLVGSAVFTIVSWNVPIQRRVYHVITTTATVTAAVSYYAMATGHANSWSCKTVRDEHRHGIPDTFHDVCRQVYWGRYVDWAIVTPLILLDVFLVAGVNGGITLIAILAGEFLVFSKLFASFATDTTGQKWGWYAISCLAYLVVVWHVVLHGAASVKGRGQGVRKLFTGLAAYTLILWTIYPIVWGIAEGARKVTVDAEIITYGVLDILTIVVFGTWLLRALRSVPDSNTEVGGYWAHGLGSEGRIRLTTDDDA